MVYLYRIGVWSYHLIIRLVAPFSHRARAFVQGRIGVFDQLSEVVKPPDNRLVWLHAASVGEFEQGLPIIQALKQHDRSLKILVTFFSPSGYNLHSVNADIDWVHYLPRDSPANARKFLNMVRPDVAIFVKYEFWYDYMRELKNRLIPLLLVSAVFRKNQIYFHPIAKFYKQAMRGVYHYFVQDQQSLQLLASIGISQCTSTGDTRFDRVIFLVNQPFTDQIVERFIKGELVVMLGSTWASDWVYLKPVVEAFMGQVKFIIAPHHVEEGELIQYEISEKVVRYAQIDHQKLDEKRVLLVDRMGMLSRLYRYANLVYVGGAFRGALHNVLEPAAYGVPVLFGYDPSNEKFVDAQGLLRAGGAQVTRSQADLLAQVSLLISNTERRREMGAHACSYVKDGAGATSRIMKEIDLLL